MLSLQAELERDGGKRSWSEVVGISVKEAKELILKEKPDAIIEVLLPGEGMTKDFQPNSVRIFIDTVAETRPSSDNLLDCSKHIIIAQMMHAYHSWHLLRDFVCDGREVFSIIIRHVWNPTQHIIID